MDFSVTPMVLGTDSKTVDNGPSYVFFALANPFTAGVVLVRDGVEPTVFLVETTVVKELFAEAGCEHLSLLQSKFNNQFVRQCVCSLEGAVVGCEDVHGCFEQVNLV